MPQHEDCGNWEYESHPDRGALTAECNAIESELLSDHNAVQKSGAFDTRPAHKRMFRHVAPKTCRCLAGSYRGTRFCKAAFKYPQVGVGGDDKVGSRADEVPAHMGQFSSDWASIESKLTEWRESTPPPADADVLIELAEGLAKLIEQFFRIHPYANGNGHTGRYLTLLIMVRMGFPPADWSIDERPPYCDAIYKYRRGQPDELQDFILKSIQGFDSPAPGPGQVTQS